MVSTCRIGPKKRRKKKAQNFNRESPSDAVWTGKAKMGHTPPSSLIAATHQNLLVNSCSSYFNLNILAVVADKQPPAERNIPEVPVDRWDHWRKTLENSIICSHKGEICISPLKLFKYSSVACASHCFSER